MDNSQQTLFDKLRRLERIFSDSDSEGERSAAQAAMDRLKTKINSAPKKPPKPATHLLPEFQYSLPDPWSVRLFSAVCRKHGVQTYRYKRQRRTTVMIRVDPVFFDAVIEPEFNRLQRELYAYVGDTLDHLIRKSMKVDADDAAEI